MLGGFLRGVSAIFSAALLVLPILLRPGSGLQSSDPTWETLIAPAVNSLRFTGRNGHASCVFKGQIWVTGGRTSVYTRYNLQPGYKTADVWRSSDGGEDCC